MSNHPLRLPVFVTDADGNTPEGPVQTIAGGYSALSLAASGVLSAVPCILVRLIVDDPGTSGTVKVWDNASAASGAGYGAPTKIATATNWIPYGIALTNGCYIELGGSAKVTGIFKAG
jgi:hypothetical protein